MLRVVASSVAKELNIKLTDVFVISTNKQTQDNKEIQGGYHQPSGDIAINDKNINNTGEVINTLGHELAHSLDDQRGETRQGTTQSGQSYSDEYANIMGDSLQDYAEFGMDNYTDKTLATTNEHVGLKTPTDNEVFDGRAENGEVDYRIVIDAKLPDNDKQNILNNMQKLTNDQLKVNKDSELIATFTKETDKPKGTELIDRLVDSDKTVTVTTGSGGNAASADNWTKAQDGTGSDSTVYFDKNSNPLIQTVDSETGKIIPKERPNQIGLGHELIHAEHIVSGEVQLTKSAGDNIYDEEKATVGIQYNRPNDITENDLRSEQNVEPRGEY